MKQRKGIILAGGTATRLFPLTTSVSKQLMPVYDKPMIYYPLSILMLANIRDILIITTQRDQEAFKNLLKDGKQWGLNFTYKIQEKPRGLADAFIIGEDFIGEDNVAMILGDNMFYGQKLSEQLERISNEEEYATIFGYPVVDPTAYGVVEIDKQGMAISIEEKPKEPRSNLAVPGLYFYPNSVIKIAKEVKPSARGEIEITSINEKYMRMNKLKVEKLGRGLAWIDTGNPDELLEAGNFIRTIENRQGMQIASPEEISYRKGWIDRETLLNDAKQYSKTKYGMYLQRLEKGEIE